MKMQFLTVAVAALMAAPMLLAQDTTAHANTAQSHMRAANGQRRGRMMANLNLTADQQTRMKAIRTKYAPQMKAARAKAKPDFDAMKTARTSHDTAAMRTAREKLRSDMAPSQNIMKQQMAEMRAVLTPEQQQKADSAQARMRDRMGARGSRAGNGFRGGMRHGAKPAQPDTAARPVAR